MKSTVNTVLQSHASVLKPARASWTLGEVASIALRAVFRSKWSAL